MAWVRTTSTTGGRDHRDEQLDVGAGRALRPAARGRRRGARAASRSTPASATRSRRRPAVNDGNPHFLVRRWGRRGRAVRGRCTRAVRPGADDRGDVHRRTRSASPPAPGPRRRTARATGGWAGTTSTAGVPRTTGSAGVVDEAALFENKELTPGPGRRALVRQPLVSQGGRRVGDHADGRRRGAAAHAAPDPAGASRTAQGRSWRVCGSVPSSHITTGVRTAGAHAAAGGRSADPSAASPISSTVLRTTTSGSKRSPPSAAAAAATAQRRGRATAPTWGATPCAPGRGPRSTGTPASPRPRSPGRAATAARPLRPRPGRHRGRRHDHQAPRTRAPPSRAVAGSARRAGTPRGRRLAPTVPHRGRHCAAASGLCRRAGRDDRGDRRVGVATTVAEQPPGQPGVRGLRRGSVSTGHDLVR